MKVAQAKELRRKGKLNREIAIALGVPVGTVLVWTKGVLPHRRPPVARRKAEVLPILERLYRQGRSVPEISRITGVPQPTLFDWRRELGLPKNYRAVYVTDALRDRISKAASRDPSGEAKEWAARFYELWNLMTLCKRCHDAFHNAAGGAVRMAIGPFFSTPNELREFPAEGAYPVAA
jgi:hypothetical protein